MMGLVVLFGSSFDARFVQAKNSDVMINCEK